MLACLTGCMRAGLVCLVCGSVGLFVWLCVCVFGSLGVRVCLFVRLCICLFGVLGLRFCLLGLLAVRV